MRFLTLGSMIWFYPLHLEPTRSLTVSLLWHNLDLIPPFTAEDKLGKFLLIAETTEAIQERVLNTQ
jgi:hypothetical protein